MASTPKVAPYGTWESPITSETLSGQGVRLADIVADPKAGCIFYLEDRPAENGRSCIVAYFDGKIQDVLPKEYSARTRIHEYGGAPMAIGSDSSVIFADLYTLGVFALHFEAKTGNVEVTPLVETNAKLRFADFDMHPMNPRWVLAVREDHRDGEEVEKIKNDIVVIDTETKQSRVVVNGADFYAHPKFSPDGMKVSWVQWNHPDMAWTGTALYTAEWKNEKVEKPHYVAGKAQKESIAQPKWSPDGTLWFVDDRTGYWQLHYSEGGVSKVKHLKLKGMDGSDFAHPEWFLGASTYVCLTANTIVAAYTKNASTRLIVIDKKTGSYTEPDFPHMDWVYKDTIKRMSETSFVMLGRTFTSPQAAYHLDIANPSKNLMIKSTADESTSTSFYSPPQHITFPRIHEREKGGQAEAHTIFSPPYNPAYTAPAGTLPPLIVSVHGGPTTHTSQTMNLLTQYWTSRGYALANLNFVGSSGYGRAFRDALNGWLGILEPADAVSCVEHLAKLGLINGKRAGIRGGSGGGYCTLQALWMYPEVFKGGVSEYGVGNIKLCHEQTHKQESHYLYALVLNNEVLTREEQDKIWEGRSAVFHADKIKAPLLLLQGLDDKVVPPNQAEDMARIMTKNGADVKTVFFEGEGHGFRKSDSQKRAVEEEEAWWRRLLVVE